MHRVHVLVDRALGPWRVAVTIVACAALGLHPALAGPPQAPGRQGTAPLRPRPIVDHAVVPAGGIGCRHCGNHDCPLRHGHLDGCRDGLCAPHCPVRPAEYGFYRTQWRRWPGQGVTPASAERAATPVPPPPSMVPSADEESPLLPAEVPPPPEDESADGAAVPVPARDAPRPEEKPADPLPSDPLPEQEPPPAKAEPEAPARPRDTVEEAAPAGPPTPPPATPPEPPAADSLFDQTGEPPAEPAVAAAPEPEGLRYPAEVGRSIAAGGTPWRLKPARHQPPAESARGL